MPSFASRPAHGGDLLGAAERYGGSPEAYLDFSANINPLGPPQTVLELLKRRGSDRSLLSRYPDPYYRALRDAISTSTGVDKAAIALANGATALLDATIRALRPASCLLPVPAFSEYAHALDRSRTHIVPFRLEAADDFVLDPVAFCEAIERSRPALCLLNNPHNPSGALLRYDAMLGIIDRASALGVRVVIDEAFIDYAPAETFTQSAAHAENLIVIRSLTKFFATPALRVGYAVGGPSLVRLIEAEVSSWSIGTMAAEAMAAALDDPEYARRTRMQNEHARARLVEGLKALGVRVFPSHANFLLIATNRASGEITRALAERYSLLVRDCATYDGLQEGGFVRIAVRNPEDNDRLLGALSEILGHGSA